MPNSATAVTRDAPAVARASRRRTGTAAAAARRRWRRRRTRLRRRAERRAELVGIEAELLARQRVERVLGSARSAVGELGGLPLRQAFGRVDQRQLLRLRLRVLLQLVALQRDLVLVQLALRAHRNVFAGRHRERAGRKSGDAGQQHQMRVAARAGDAEDQARVRHQAVVDAEHGGAQVAAAAEVAMTALDVADRPSAWRGPTARRCDVP